MVGGSLGFFAGYVQASDNKTSRNNLLSGKFAAAGVGAVTGIVIGALLGGLTKIENFSTLNDYLSPELKIRAGDDWRVSFSMAF